MVEIKVRFVIDANDANKGKIVFDITNDYANVATTYRVGVTGPLGVVKALPGTPDDTGLSGQVLVTIPTTSSGAYLNGNYTFRVVIDETGTGSGETVDDTIIYCFSTSVNQDLDTEVIVDCYSKNVVVNDNTSYPTDADIVRLITVSPPTIAYEEAQDDFTTDESQLIVDLTRDSGVAYENVAYGVLITVQVSTSEITEINSSENNWNIGVTYAMTPYNQDEGIHCNFDPCGILECVNNEVTSILDTACKRGGIGALSKTDSDKLNLLQLYLSMYNYWRECKDYDQTNYYYDKIKALVGDCGCSAPTGPQAIPESGIVYLRGYSAYDLWIQAGNEGTIDDFFASLYPVGEWTDVDGYHGDYEGGTDPLQFRILKTHIEFRGEFTGVIGGATSSNPFDLLLTFAPGYDVDTLGYVVIFDGANNTGRLSYNSATGRWIVHWNTNFNRTHDQRVSGLIPLESVATSPVILHGDWTVFPSSAFDNSYDVAGGTFLQWRTDGKYVYIRGSFGGPAWASSGFTFIKASYFTGLGLTLEPNYKFPLVDMNPTQSKGAPGFVLVGSDNSLKVYTIASVTTSNFDVAHEHGFNGIIPLA